MNLRRSTTWFAGTLSVLLTLTLAGTVTTATSASGTADRHGAKALTTGRFITTDKPGVVLVDENGKRPHTILRANKATLADVHPATGTFLWSSGGGSKATWHVANIYGADLASFRVPAGSSIPAIDSGGYNAYWVRPSSGGQEAAVISFDLNDPQATPQVVRTLGAGSAEQLSVAPDDHAIAVVIAGSLHLVSINGNTDEVVPNPAGATAYAGRAVWSPTSGQVAFRAGAAGDAKGAAYVANAAGDHTPTVLGAAAGPLLDWSPDGALVLSGNGRSLTGIPTAGGPATSYNIAHTPEGTGLFWSGLKAGKVPTDRIRPDLKIAQPDCGKKKGAACDRYRHTTAAWRTIGGPATDKGGSLLRYVAVAVFQKRGSQWWALVADGDKHPGWKRFPNYVEARYTAKERTAQISGGRWSLRIPALQAGQLYVVAKARDGAGNNAASRLQQSLN
jgi:hypothetical protein